MTITLIESALDAVYSFLSTNIATKLNTLDTEYGDLTLDDIVAWYLGELPVQIPEYPSICIRASGEILDVQRSINLQVKCLLDIIIFYGNADITERFRRLARYARAVVELLNEGEGTIGRIVTVTGTITFSEVQTQSPFLQGVIIPISTYGMETF